jgi:hypothetical protein
MTPFLIAVQENQTENTKLFAELGCNIWAKEEKLENALHIAFKNKSSEMIRLVTFLDSDKNCLRTQIDIKKRRPADLDPYKKLVKFTRNPWELVKAGKLECLASKIKNGKVGINDFTFKKKNTFLHLAVKFRQTPIVRFLVLTGAEKEMKNYKNLTPLQIALNDKNRIYFQMIENLFTCQGCSKLPRPSLSNVRSNVKRISLKEVPNRKSLISLKVVLPTLHSNINETMSKYLF